jgi:vacuolar-type H+-ATPase subunit F/Vma7
VEKVAHYAGVSPDVAESSMEEIADEAVIAIHQAIGDKHTAEKVKEYMRGQRHIILVHLPAAMQLGDLLNDNSMDDRTNKMEGPISSLMHKIENSLSKNDETKYP